MDKNASFRKPGWTLRVIKGRGAGYIGGWTFYVARGDLHRREATRAVGFTRNAQMVPITKH